MPQTSQSSENPFVPTSAALLSANTFNALVYSFALRLQRSAAALPVVASRLNSQVRRRKDSVARLRMIAPSMRPVSLFFLAIVAVAGLPLSAFATVAASDIIKVQNATACTGSQLQGASTGTICFSGTSGNFVPFSLTALENGTESLPSVIGSQTAPVYLIKNDTASTSMTLTYTGVVQNYETLLCQEAGNYASAACSIDGPLGLSAGVASATYGTTSTTWPNQVVVQYMFTGVAVGTTFDFAFTASYSTDSGTLSGPCYGACQVPASCSGSANTTVTGTVYMPNGTDPLPNALVYIPNTLPGPLTAGVQCLTNGTPAQGGAVTQTYSAVDGTFTLTNVPTGSNIPIVIQSGKWRMQGTISSVKGCVGQTAPLWATTMPSSHLEGDIPKIALVTGSVDSLECVLRKTGINDSEFTDKSGNGQINLYYGAGSAGVKIDSSTLSETTLESSSTTLAEYDMIMFACQGGQYTQSSANLANVLNWANSGGRLFGTHYSYVWLYDNPTSSTGFGSTADWNVNWDAPSPDPGMATVNTAFAGGSTLANWLQLSAVGASTTLGQIQISTLRLDQSGIVSPTQSWLTLNSNTTDQSNYSSPKEPANPVMQMTFNTPVGAAAANQCGRVLFNEYHVENNSNLGGKFFPTECTTGAMTPQEHLLEYALFDLSTAITPVVTATVSQSYVNTPASFTQGDSADQIAIDVTNTSSTVDLSASLQVAGTLPTGVTVNTSSFTSGGWSCTSPSGGSTFTCTRTTILAAGASDTIDVPVAVGFTAVVGTGTSLTSTASGGGMASNVVGSDPLTILAGSRPQAIVFSPSSPVSYGVSPITLSATGGASGNPVTFSIVSGPGTLSGVNNSTLTVTGTGTIVIAANQAGNSTYTAAPQVTGSIVVNPAALFVTANSFTRSYGTANPTLTVAITGFVNGDSSSVVAGSAALSTSAIITSPVGSYAITAAQGTLAAANYIFSFVPGNLAVTKGSGAITWSTPAAITYGASLSATQLNAAATCAGSTVSGTYAYTPTLGAVLAAGTQTLSVTFTPADTTDCPVESTTVSLTVNKAVLTVTAANATRTYGTANPTLTSSISGFVNSDSFSVVTGAAALSTTATSTSPVGSYPITAAQGTLAASNYTFSTVNGTLTVTQGLGAISWASPAAITYGASLSATQLNAAATCGGVTVAGVYSYSPATGSVLTAGTQTLHVTFTPTDTTDCPTVSTTVSEVVNPAVLTVTAANQSRTYGTANPTLTSSIAGFVNSDISSVVTGAAALSTTATSTSPVGSYPITAAQGTLAASNYTFSTVNGTLTVTQGLGAISWASPAAITYGASLSATQLNATATCGGVTVAGVYSYSPALGTVLTAGTQTLHVTFTPTDTTDCPTVSTTVTEVVNPAVLTVTANNLTKTYGSANPTLTRSIAGFVNGDGSSVVTGAAALSTTATSTSPVGSYPITAAQGTLAASNYTFTTVNGTLTVTQGLGSISWASPAAIIYGAALGSTQLNAAATCGGVTVAGVYSYSPALGTVLTAGTQTLHVTFTPTDTTDCPTVSTTVSEVVNPAVLTVTANNLTKTYGSGNPALTNSITGFVNSDSSSVVTGSAALSTTATSSSPVGSYPITAAQGTLAASNYTFSYVNGTLTVTQGLGNISWASPAAITYGAALGTSQLNASATCGGVTVPGVYSYSPASGAVLTAGTQTLHVTFTPTDTTDCPTVSTTVSEVVNPAVLTVTANNLTKTYGSANPALTNSITGFVNGDGSSVVTGAAALGTTATSTSPVGSYPITAAQGTLAASNYTFSYVNGTLTVTQGLGNISWSAPVAITYGSALGATQLNAAATCGGVTVPGVYSYSPASGAVLTAGTQTLHVTFTPTDTTDCPTVSTTVTEVVNPAVLTVTANNLTKTYGSANPALTNSITGFVNGDGSSVVTGSAALSTTATTTSPVGSYPITIAQGTLAASNYTFTTVNGTLAVTQGNGAISWSAPAAITYGSVLSATQLNAAATCGGVTVPGVYSYSPASGSVLAAGTQTLHVTFTPTDTTDCPVEATTVSLTVNKAILTVTAANQSRTYGTANPTLTSSIAGFVNSDSFSVVTGAAALSTTATSTSPVGSYPITAAQGTLAASNYTFSTVNGTLAVTQGNGAISWSAPAAITYGSVLSATQLNAAATCGGVTVAGVYSYSPASGSVLAAGTQTLHVTFTPTDTTDCPTVSTTVTEVVNSAVLTVTANNVNMTYGGPIPSFTDTITGFVNGDSSSVVSGTATMSTTATTTSAAGTTYPISFATENLAASNYTFIYVPGTLTVTQGSGAITWTAPAAIPYGTALSATQLDANATCNGSTVAGAYVYTPALGTILNAGAQTLNVTFTPTNTANCPAETTTVSLNVTKAALTVTANNLTKAYSAANPTLTDAITGFVNGDTSASLSGAATMATTAITTSPVGAYPITFATQTLANPNYAISYVPGTLTVTQGVGAITWATPAAITAGTALSATQLNAVATCGGISVPGVYTYLPAAGTILTAGTQTLKVTFTPTDTTDCPTQSTTVQLVVNPAPQTNAVTMTFSNTVWTYPGEANITVCVAPATSAVATGTAQIFDGTTLLTTVTLQPGGCGYWYITPGLTAGTHVLSATYSGDKNNPAGTSAPSTINVALGPMTMEASCWNDSFPYGADYQCNANTDSGPKSGYMTYSYDGGAPVKMTLDKNGATVWSFSKPPVGKHTLLIAYPQQGNYVSAVLPLNTFVVTPAPVLVAITPSSWYLNVGTPLTFNVALTSWSAGPPKALGTVSFYDGTTLLGTSPVNAAGQASYTTSTLVAGTHNIAATYSGSANYGTATSTITITTVAAPPAFSQAAGVYSAPQTVALATTTKGGVIYYTTNGSAPTAVSARYTAPIKVTASTTIAAITVATGYTNSPVVQAQYTIVAPAATPAFSVAAGTYTSTQTVTITDASAGATIYYTTNGSAPTTSSAKYTGPITVSATETVQAIATATNCTTSAVASAKYTITPPAATPAFSLAAGTYTGAQTIKISDATGGATIYYTTNGTAPTTSSTKYTGPVTVKASETVQAIAIATSYSNSAVASAKYTIK